MDCSKSGENHQFSPFCTLSHFKSLHLLNAAAFHQKKTVGPEMPSLNSWQYLHKPSKQLLVWSKSVGHAHSHTSIQRGVAWITTHRGGAVSRRPSPVWAGTVFFFKTPKKKLIPKTNKVTSVRQSRKSRRWSEARPPMFSWQLKPVSLETNLGAFEQCSSGL